MKRTILVPTLIVGALLIGSLALAGSGGPGKWRGIAMAADLGV